MHTLRDTNLRMPRHKAKQNLNTQDEHINPSHFYIVQ